MGGLLASELYRQTHLVHIRIHFIKPVYTLCRVQDAEKKCQEFEARARSFLVQGIKERQRAVRLLIAARECLRQKEI